MPLFTTGSTVEVRGERWLLTAVSPHGPCTVLTLEGRDEGNARQRLAVVEPFERTRPITPRLTRRSRRAVLRAALRALGDARAPGRLWTAASAAIDVWAYQLEPALAAIRGTTRLLLADAVGLGKTIQAGLLLAELRERGWIERALIVCPAGLRDTWARELHARFGITAAVIDHAAIAGRVASLPPGMNPWSGYHVAIASIDFIKRPEIVAAIEEQPIDLLIADEAHHLTPGTDRGGAISRLALRATWLVLMSATPHSGDVAAFDYLTGLGAHGDALAIFRRTRSDVGLQSWRRSHVLPVAATEAEAMLFEGIDRYARAMWRERGRGDPAVRLVAVTLLRRAASNSRAILRTLRRRLELLDAAPPVPVQPRLPWDDADDADDVEADVMLATPGLQSLAEERSVVSRLIELADRCGDGSKLRRLVRFLDRVREPVVVFTEYRDTLEAIEGRVGDMRRVAAIHGGMPPELRRAAVDAFNDGRVEVLIATDAAGEGLNLHHRSRIVIDIELPWNPLRLEQRAGRVDRLGQRRTVHVIRFFHPGTIEQQVLAHLTLRGQRAAAALDLHRVTQAAIAEAIFEGRPLESRASTALFSRRIVEATGEAARIEHQRLVHGLDARPADGATWAAPRRPKRSAKFILLGRHRFINERGAIAGEALSATVACIRAGRTPREWRERIESAWRATSGEPTRLPDDSDGRIRVERRITRIREYLGRVRVEHQGTLFDRRDEQLRLDRERSIAVLNDALTRTLSAMAAPSPDQARSELIAAWPEAPR